MKKTNQTFQKHTMDAIWAYYKLSDTISMTK